MEYEATIGYRLRAPGVGVAVISVDGSAIRFASEGTRWPAHRFLLGRVIPFAAVVHGIEAFHASAVGLGGRAIAFFGPSAAGKSSVALNLALLGCSFVSDDVLAVEPCEAGVCAHPGAGVASVRHSEYDSLRPVDRGRVGSLLDRADRAYLNVEREERTLPLTGLYYLARGGARLAFRRISPPEPRLLLASTFVFEVRTVDRMLRQLEVCALLASSASAFELRMPPSMSAADAAAAIRVHANEHAGPAL